MDRRLRYHPLFDCDVREAAAWYDRRAAGLGAIFIDQVESRVSDVVVDPDRFAKTPAGCRYVRIGRFPYIVLFDVGEDEIVFLGVMHTARSVEKWRDRQSDT